ncbi:ribonuclease H-like domain-containing protein [Tanacetum coccineum]
MKKIDDTINENTNDNVNLLKFFDTPYLQNSNPTNTLPNDESEAESLENVGESSSFESINTSDDESFGNDGITDDIAHSSHEDNTVELTSTSEDDKVKYGIQKHVNYSKLSKENYCFSTSLNKTIEPSTYHQACTSKDWVAAMNTEMEALNKNNTWEVTELPPERKPIGCKWIYKIKYKSNGDIETYKARLVAKGYSQKEGVDYDETFSPMVKMVTIRCLISLVVNQGWTLFQLDVNNAFLYGNLTEEVYMTLPPGYFSVDDKRGLCLSQRKYCLELLSEYGLLACKPYLTIESKLIITDKPMYKKDKPLKNIIEYQKLLGKLIYLTHTRPDISYTVHSLSQFMHSPLNSHLKLALRILKYLNEDPGKGVHISKSSNIELTAYVDSDWAKCKATRRSVTRFKVFWENLLYHGKAKNKPWLLDLLLKQNIEPWRRVAGVEPGQQKAE